MTQSPTMPCRICRKRLCDGVSYCACRACNKCHIGYICPVKTHHGTQFGTHWYAVKVYRSAQGYLTNLKNVNRAPFVPGQSHGGHGAYPPATH